MLVAVTLLLSPLHQHAILAAAVTDRIRHIVVLMEENRSFDHLFGWYRGTKQGLNGSEYNLVNASDPLSERVYVTNHSRYVALCDPAHSTPATDFKIFGREKTRDPHTGRLLDEMMSGFVQYETMAHAHHPAWRGCGVMDMFAPERLPVMTTLAQEFVLMDQFFCSYPGPTWPNRLFFLSGTSNGLTETIPWFHDTPGKLFPQPTIFDQVADAGGTWRLYYADTPWEIFVETIAHHPANTQPMGTFYADAAAGTLPDFSFINPRSGINVTTGHGSDDMHPDHDVALGEKLYKDIYEALRAGPAWNETLFVITFDEHGGFYDHVPPPRRAPPPDDTPAYPDKTVRFDRGGVRIPTLLISPWLPRGHVETHPPARQKPSPDSVYELTSIMATSRKLLSILNTTGPLTRRDAWAATFDHLFSELDEPRTDCPTTLPPAPPPALTSREERFRPLNHLQSDLVHIHRHLQGPPLQPDPPGPALQGEVSAWLQHRYHSHVQSTLQWRRSRSSARLPSVELEALPQLLRLDLKVAPFMDAEKLEGMVAHAWDLIWNHTEATATTISTSLPHDLHPANDHWCITVLGGSVQEGSMLGIVPCYPSRDIRYNRDGAQQWRYTPDATVRPWMNSSLCVTSDAFVLDPWAPWLYLRPCSDLVGQHFAYQATSPGQPGNRQLLFGAWSTAGIMVVRRASRSPRI